MGILNERVGDQKKLHTAMRDEAFSIVEQLTDLNAKNKVSIWQTNCFHSNLFFPLELSQ